MLTHRTFVKRLGQAAGVMTAIVAMALMATAQDYQMHSGSPSRDGLPVDAYAGAFAPNVYNNPGRHFLRWWDPVSTIFSTLDNDETSVTGTTVQTPPGSWGDPTLQGTVAFNYFQRILGVPIYRYTATVRGTSATDRTAGATAAYSFVFTGLTATSEYEASLNLPVGPTDLGVALSPDFRFPQKYWIVRISDVQGGDVIDTLDYDTRLGTFVRLGNNGNETSRTFAPLIDRITVTLYNTSAIDSNGQYLDPRLNADPTLVGRQLVYADAAQLVTQSKLGTATYHATPIVGSLKAPPIGGGPEAYPWRTTAARIEETRVGDLNRTYNFGITSSYDYNGTTVPSAFGFRFNKIWDWPARRPYDRSDAETTRYSRDKRDWIMAVGMDRIDQNIQLDNLNGGATATANFLSQASGVDNIGPDFLATPAIGGAPTEQATFGTNLPDGKYFVDVWLPGDLTLARSVNVEFYEGGVLVSTLVLNQNGPRGWARLPFEPVGGFSHSQLLPLSVVITNHTGNVLDVGKNIYADAVRFVRQSDLSVDSTPLQTTTTIQTAGGPVQRDVTVVAMENGRLYCMDAHGDPATGAPPTQYWSFPTEGATDPNNAVLEDGKDRIAEMPYGFDLSSALVANVGGVDLLYIASQNGKIYCLEMTGRGDGSTRRRWTYPDDYDPSNPNLPMQAGLRPIVGSIAFGLAGATPVIIVPTQEGRILALDAAGNVATRKTTPVWQYPLAINPVLGPVKSTPVVAFGKVYFCATDTQVSTVGHVYAVNMIDGSLAWDQDGAGIGNFNRFDASSPVAVPGTMLTAPGGTWDNTTLDAAGADRVFVCDAGGKFASLDSLTGAVVWNTDEIGVGSAGPLRFGYGTQFDNVAALVNNVPMVYVADLGGSLTGLSAVGQQNKNSNYKVWGYTFSGTAQVATMAPGGFNLATGNPHSWLYSGDSEGNLYAFNSIDDNNIFPIIPGVPPGFFDGGDNEAGQDDLDAAIDPTKFLLLSPFAYDQLREWADDPGRLVSSTDISNLVASDRINRRHYDFGETLYLLIYDLPVGQGNNVGYYIDFQISSVGHTPQRRQQPTRTYSDNANLSFVLLGMPLMTNGTGGIGPGPNFITARAVAPGNRGLQGTTVHLPKPASFVPPQECDFYVANPLAIAFLDDLGIVSSSVTLPSLSPPPDPRIQTNPAAPDWGLYNKNGNTNTDQNPTGGPVEPIGPVGPDLRSKGQPVAHGATGVQQLYVADRSMMALLNGRGFSGARVGPHDIAWVKDLGDPVTGGTYKPLLANGIAYPGFEDYPLFVPNLSADYPDVGRESLNMVSNLFGQAQNPLYVQGVDLNPPIWSQVNFQNYRLAVNYELQMIRVMSPNIFEINMDVPRYQPPSNLGYYGSQLLFLDFQQGNPNFDPTQGSYRTFGLGLNVGIDEKVVFKTPTIDEGSLPSGGGFNGGPTGGPVYPWDPATLFSPWNNNFNNMFQAFTLVNEGNVNMLSLRTAKYFFDANGNRPVELFMPGQHELAWIDASLHLHTSLDPRFSASRLVGIGNVGFDPQARNILQKPRPRDLIGSRFNVNPRSRPNASLFNVGGFLYDPLIIPPGDPKMGVTAPIGAPAGQYIRRIFAFEDSNTGNNVNADNPSLGTDEPYTDPGVNLKFTVREDRMTNIPTIKSAPLIENLLAPNATFAYSNTQPSAMRDGLGNLYVTWASNRVDAANNPNFVPKTRLETDLVTPEKWRIYIGSLRNVLGNALGESPINELNAFTADTPGRWFRQTLVIDPPTTLFTLAPGETLDLNSVAFGAPAFGNGGFFNQLDYPDIAGRAWYTGRFITFIGEANKYDAAGNTSHISQVFMAPIVCAADGSVTLSVSDISVSPFEPTTKKSKPAMTHQHNGNGDFATVYTTSMSNGNGQVTWHNYALSNQSWTFGNLRLGPAFENMGAPSSSLHRYQNGDNLQQAILSFTAKVKGRRFSEVYLMRVRVDDRGFPAGRNPVQPFGSQANPFIDELTSDPGTGTFWAPGLQWLTDQNSLDQIDVTTTSDGDPLNTIWDGKTSTREFDAAAGVLRFNSKLGGEVVIDTNTGAVRMPNAVFRRNTRLFVVYRPTIMRMSEGAGANYRSIASAYDDRFIGIRVNPANPQRNLLGDLGYWIGNPNAATENDPLRWDRTILSYTRTSGDGTAAARPYFQTLRYGVRLDHGIRTDQNGAATFFQVSTWGTGVATEQFAQFDPATGRVFFLSGNEDSQVVIRYDAVDENGNFLGQLTEEHTVRMITEIAEQAVPIEQVGNESAMSIALDPLNAAFNNINPQTGRRPGLLWFFWTSSRAGQPEVFFETVAPRFSPRRADQ